MPVSRSVSPAAPSARAVPAEAPKRRAPRGTFEPSYVTRKRLTAGELLTAAGAGLGVALAVFYVVKVWLERTPVLPPGPAPKPSSDGEPAGAMNRTVTPQRAAP